MSTPDFLVIGAMKCGTSTLAAQLASQSGVFVTNPKEPNFFSDDDIYLRGPDWYAALFQEASADEVKGEASTHYTKLPTYPETIARMRAMLPAPRLIYLIRNPMMRAKSHYIHEWLEGRVGNDPERAFAECPEIVHYGCYGMQIAPYVDTYGTERILLTSLEQITADPDQEFARITGFLGLTQSAGWKHDLPAQNVSNERFRRLPMTDILIDNPVARGVRRTLVPKALRTWVRNRRKMTARPEIPEDLARRMQLRFQEDRAYLAGFFPNHPALDLCYPFVE